MNSLVLGYRLATLSCTGLCAAAAGRPGSGKWRGPSQKSPWRWRRRAPRWRWWGRWSCGGGCRGSEPSRWSGRGSRSDWSAETRETVSSTKVTPGVWPQLHIQGVRCKHKGVAYAKVSMVQSKTTNWVIKCSCGSSCTAFLQASARLFGRLKDRETVERLVFHVRSRSHWQCQQKHTRSGHQRSWKTSECACGEGLCASLPCLGSDHL